MRLPRFRRVTCVEHVGSWGRRGAGNVFSTHAAFTYYDPSVPINVLAEPTKWETVVTGTAFIANQRFWCGGHLEFKGACTPTDAGGLASLFRRLVEQLCFALGNGARLTEMRDEGLGYADGRSVRRGLERHTVTRWADGRKCGLPDILIRVGVCMEPVEA